MILYENVQSIPLICQKMYTCISLISILDFHPYYVQYINGKQRVFYIKVHKSIEVPIHKT